MSLPTATMAEDDLLVGLVGDGVRPGALTVGGWLWTHTRRPDLGLTMGTPGVPDIIAVHPQRRRVLALELKALRGRFRPGQEGWLVALREAGVDARVVRPEDYDALVDELVGDRVIERRSGRMTHPDRIVITTEEALAAALHVTSVRCIAASGVATVAEMTAPGFVSTCVLDHVHDAHAILAALDAAQRREGA